MKIEIFPAGYYDSPEDGLPLFYHNYDQTTISFDDNLIYFFFYPINDFQPINFGHCKTIKWLEISFGWFTFVLRY